MPRLVELFDCFLVRRFWTGDDAGRAQDEQNTAPGVGYRSEPTPTAGYREQIANHRSQDSSSDEALETLDSETYSRASTSSEVSSSDCSQTGDQTGIGDQRSFAFKGLDELGLFRPRSACSISSTSGFRDQSDSESDTDDDEEGGERFFDGYARKSGVCYYSLGNFQPSSTLTQPLRLLSSEDMAAIEALFCHPGARHVARETGWGDFTRTMTRLGFSMMPGAGGAVRRFEVVGRSDLIPARSEGEVITAHEPHGRRTTLGRRRMRGTGRRLTNAFGWSAETFGRE
ncbi:hypothetical protein F4782DRAFT_546359 [Xylaria castorea]|nr:hypothetical protein F4782DRAFT_546359 [Xylaria castorea]